MDVKVYALVCVILLIRLAAVQGRKVFPSPIGEAFYVFGVGSSCRYIPFNETSLLHQRARYHDGALRYFFSKYDHVSSVWKWLRQYKYVNFDVCENMETLTELAIDIMLKETYTLLQDPSRKARRTIKDWFKQSKILLIFTFVPTRMFQSLSAHLSGTNILIMNIYEDISFENNFYSAPTRFLRIFDETRNFLHEILVAMKWKYVTMVSFQGHTPAYKSVTDQYHKLFKNNKVCFNTEIILKKQNREATRDNIKKDSEIKVILLLGTPDEQTDFMKLVGKSNKTWIINDNFGEKLPDESEGHIFSILDGFFKYDSVFSMFFDTTRTYASMLPERYKDVYSFVYLFNVFKGLMYFHTNYQNILKVQNNITMIKLDILTKARDIALSLHIDAKEGIQKTYNSETKNQLLSDIPGNFTSVECPHIMCKPGNEYIFRKLLANESVWNESFHWICDPCQPGFFKPNYGNKSCVKCPIYEVPNTQRDSCFDPYKRRSLQSNHPFSIFALCLNGFGLCSCIVVFTTFVKFRNTPMMKATDVKMTIVHLFVCFIMLIGLPVSFLGEPSIEKCTIKLLLLTICYTIWISIILLRSQNVLKAFQSKIKLTKTEIRKAKLGQVFAIFLLAIISNLIFLIVTLTKPIVSLLLIDHQLLEKTKYCNTWTHFNVLIAFSIFLQLICFVQAFRARRLPGPFKNTMPIVYGSFITTITFIIVYPIVYFQSNVLDRDGVYWIAISFSTDILLMFCYFRRIYIAIFKPHKNTVEYSRAIIMAKMNKESKVKVKTSSS